jgi:hypothetical protein
MELGVMEKCCFFNTPVLQNSIIPIFSENGSKK